MYFDEDSSRKEFYSLLQRFSLSDSIPCTFEFWRLSLVSIYTKEDSNHEMSFIPLPRLDGDEFASSSFVEVPTYQQSSLLWRKLRQCCLKLDETSYPYPTQDETKQKEIMDEIVTACNTKLYLLLSFLK